MTETVRVAPPHLARPAVAETAAAMRHRLGKLGPPLAAAGVEPGITVAPDSVRRARVAIDGIGRTTRSPSRSRLFEEKPVMKSPAGYTGVTIGLAKLPPVFVLGLWVFAIQPAAADEPHPVQAGKSRPNCVAPAPPAAPPGSPGLRAFVDPITGELTTPPAGRRPDDVPAPQAEFSTSDEGLVEVPVRGPVPGVMVHLQGRFRSSLTATVGPDGKIRVRHETPCADGAESKR